MDFYDESVKSIDVYIRCSRNVTALWNNQA
jgi:hypothetical protein